MLSPCFEIPLTMEWKDKMCINEKLRKAAQESKIQFLKIEKSLNQKWSEVDLSPKFHTLSPPHEKQFR